MGKLGGKLKCMIKRWNSSSRINRSGSGESTRSDQEDTWRATSASSFHGDEIPAGLRPVYVGKSRRRYLVSTDVVCHPLFQTLIDRTGGSATAAGEGAAAAVGCEVVLFEHLLWMLENADPQPESLDELVEFYAC